MSDQRPWSTREARIGALEDILRRRIVILDGATGTMIQERRLSEADIRGHRFADHPCDLQADYDLVALTQPQVVRDI
jgi:5-methyltetrahydrofolate--homocysteine methyltransferase